MSRIFAWILFGICAFFGFVAIIMGAADPTEAGDDMLGGGIMLIVGAAWLLIITLLLAGIAEGLAKFGNKISVEATLGGK
jgi:hypothetical protein